MEYIENFEWIEIRYRNGPHRILNSNIFSIILGSIRIYDDKSMSCAHQKINSPHPFAALDPSSRDQISSAHGYLTS